MAYEHQWVPDLTLLSAANLSAAQYHFAFVNSSGQAALVASAGDMAIGVIQNNPNASAMPTTIRCIGVTKVVAGGVVAAGDAIACNASGRAVVATTGRVNTSDAGAANDPLIASNVMGIALTAAAANGEVITVFLNQMGAAAQTEQ